MSFSKSRAGVGVVMLAVMLLTTSRGNTADFGAVQLELPTQATAAVADFNLNFATTGSTALFYFDRESFQAQQGEGIYSADSDAAAAVSWEILWQQPALVPVSAVPEPSVGITLMMGVILLYRWIRGRGRIVAAAA
jgi:hypothetical protein